MDPAALNDLDISGITNEANKWKADGYYADYNLSKKSEGLAMLALENLVTGDGSVAYFEIHKLQKRHQFGFKTRWIIQLHSSDEVGGKLEQHGCVSGITLIGTMIEAQLDLKHGFRSGRDYELAMSTLCDNPQ